MSKIFVTFVMLGAIAAVGDVRPLAQTLPAPTVPLSALPQIEPHRILDHIKILGSDKFQGRAPGTQGEDLTVSYLASQFKNLGLKPGNPDGTYIQKVPLVGITGSESTPLVFSKGGTTLQLKWKDDVVAWSKHVAPAASIANSDVVFVGYGVTAPEYHWDDFKGIDVKGKTVVVLVNDPPVPDPADPAKLDPKTFGGRAMTYYGRWTYKFEEGARRGAAAVLIVHQTVRQATTSGSCRATSARSSTSSRVTRTCREPPSRAGSPSTPPGAFSRWPAGILTRWRRPRSPANSSLCPSG